MDRRKKRTSSEQYEMYIDLMESDPIFASGRVPRDLDAHYLTKKWKELSEKLNKCSSGPTLTSDEWRKRLNDWKNTTRCKYRRSLTSNEKDITMSSLEMRALDLFGKVPSVNSGDALLNLKSEKDDNEDDIEQHRTSETFQKELQAAVEEAINDAVEELVEEHNEHEDMLEENIHETSGGVGNSTNSTAGATTAVNTGGTSYRTIMVDNSYVDEEPPPDPIEYIATRRSANNNALHTVVTTTSAGGVTAKLINGELPVKRLRTAPRDQIIYEVKAPRAYATIQTAGTTSNLHNTTPSALSLNSTDAQQIAYQLKRLADIKYESLQFEIARFKFNNPGFHYNPPAL